MSNKCVLIIGGAGSGKSHFAQELALKLGGPVLFVATAEAGDEEMRRRIDAHRRRRPPDWKTLEVTTSVGQHILKETERYRTVVVDCVTLLVNNVFSRQGDGESIETPLLEEALDREIGGLIEAVRRSDAGFIIVSNEVGLGIVPANAMGRLYRDLLARANRALAAVADEVYLTVAGLPVVIKGEGSVLGK